MKQLSVREYELCKIGPKPVDNAISKAELDVLYQISKRRSVRFFEQKGPDNVQFFQHVGIVSTGTRMLEILPKIDSEEKELVVGGDDFAQSIRLNLMRMLFVAYDLDVTEAEFAEVNEVRESWIDILILLFCRRLADQVRRGIARRYRVDKHNLNVVAGRILVHEQLRDNLIHRERIACEYDELDENHSLNQALKVAIVRMQGAANSWRSRLVLNKLRMVFDGIEDRLYRPEWVNAIRLDRLTQRFSSCLELARLFLSGLSPTVGAGKHDSFALLFDMNKLFERYIGRLMSEVVRPFGHRLKMQHSEYSLMADGTFKLKPDMVTFQYDRRPVCIADTKWKRLDIDERKLGISQADLYQMLAYACRYECDDLILLYPFHRHDGNSTPFCKHFEYEKKPKSRVTVAQISLADLASVREQLAEIYGRAVRLRCTAKAA